MKREKESSLTTLAQVAWVKMLAHLHPGVDANRNISRVAQVAWVKMFAHLHPGVDANRNISRFGLDRRFSPSDNAC